MKSINPDLIRLHDRRRRRRRKGRARRQKRMMKRRRKRRWRRSKNLEGFFYSFVLVYEPVSVYVSCLKQLLQHSAELADECLFEHRKQKQAAH